MTATEPECVTFRNTMAARHVRPGDTIELPDPVTGVPTGYVVVDVVHGWVWVGADRVETVLVATDPETGRGRVCPADAEITVVERFPDQPEPTDPHPGEAAWW